MMPVSLKKTAGIFITHAMKPEAVSAVLPQKGFEAAVEEILLIKT